MLVISENGGAILKKELNGWDFEAFEAGLIDVFDVGYATPVHRLVSLVEEEWEDVEKEKDESVFKHIPNWYFEDHEDL